MTLETLTVLFVGTVALGIFGYVKAKINEARRAKVKLTLIKNRKESERYRKEIDEGVRRARDLRKDYNEARKRYFDKHNSKPK